MTWHYLFLTLSHCRTPICNSCKVHTRRHRCCLLALLAGTCRQQQFRAGRLLLSKNITYSLPPISCRLTVFWSDLRSRLVFAGEHFLRVCSSSRSAAVDTLSPSPPAATLPLSCLTSSCSPSLPLPLPLCCSKTLSLLLPATENDVGPAHPCLIRSVGPKSARCIIHNILMGEKCT